ncbi:stalk domain-containing protein [Paenibacillus sp. GCM10027626]|uniref:stalk domain-containing protein n=1 Tax=Paenibacillus sp. GCM10027626 TaxID=3273411 RepID=UPI00363C3E2C
MKKKWMATIAAAGLLLSTTAGVYAGSNLQEIKAFFDSSIKFTVDGKSYQPVNDKGVPTLPIVHNGTTYLPVRAISNALGVTVKYDGKTKTVALGEQAKGTPIAAGFDSMYHSKDPKVTMYNGKDYKDVYFDDATGGRNSSFMLYPKGKYQKLYLQVAAVGKDIEEIKVEDSGTNTVLAKESVAIDDGLKTIVVDISGVQELYIYADLDNGGKMFVPLTTSYYK